MMKMVKVYIKKKASHPFEDYALIAKFIEVDDAVNYGLYLIKCDKTDSVLIDKKSYTPLILNKKDE